MSIKIINNETTYAVTLSQLKDFLRIEGGDEDSTVFNLLIAAHDLVVKYLNKSITTRTITAYYDEWQYAFELPYGPVQSLTHIKYYDYAGGAAQTVDPLIYYVTPDAGIVVRYINSLWPTSVLRPKEGIEIQYVAGYATEPSEVPFGIRQGVLHTAAALYENREDSTIPMIAQSILSPYREWL